MSHGPRRGSNPFATEKMRAHLRVARGYDVRGIIHKAHLAVSSRFGILHSTFQPEPGEGEGCETASCPGAPPDLASRSPEK